MRYQFRCPLCLKRLGPNQSMVAFRIVDTTSEDPPRSIEVNCGDEDFIGEIVRFGGKAIYTPVTEKSVFVSHIQCDAGNPFWTTTTETNGDEVTTTTKVVIPGNAGDGKKIRWTFSDEKSGTVIQKVMQHQIIEMLRSTQRYDEYHRPMWFPFAMLRSTATVEDDDLDRPFGSLVEMASAPGVGKTILTLQLMNRQLYAKHPNRIMEIANYFFPRREGEENINLEDAFMREVFFHSTWSRRPEFRPPPTPDLTPGDLRAIFIRPVRGMALTHSPQRSEQSKRTKSLRKAGGTIFSGLVYAIREVFKGGSNDSEPPPTDLTEELGKTRYWYPVLFYDTAGEAQLNASGVTKAVRHLTNKLAICIDAQEIFDKKGNNTSIHHACERIRTRMQEEDKKSSCLIITKLDLLASYPEQKTTFMRIAEDLEAPETEARQLLIKWLREHSDHDKDDLRNYLQSREGYIEKVLFVWTENLPKVQGIRPYPIDSFQPERGDVGTEVTLKATDGYDFNEAKNLYFNGKEATFHVESDKIIKTTVPAGATTGFIEIKLRDNESKDEGTSERYFVVGTQGEQQPTLPQSYGLIKFLSWCLDKSPKEFVEELESGDKEANNLNQNS